jgi:hypothetical protein
MTAADIGRPLGVLMTYVSAATACSAATDTATRDSGEIHTRAPTPAAPAVPTQFIAVPAVLGIPAILGIGATRRCSSRCGTPCEARRAPRALAGVLREVDTRPQQ